jgi:transcriptional regulator with XRE-family HTH domain
MTAFAQRFGRTVRQLREARGLSQQQAAAKAGIDRAYYWKIEKGEANPSLDVIGRIVKMLKVPAGELFTESDRQ